MDDPEEDWENIMWSKYKFLDHISPVLSTLHWLPIKHRIQVKILLLIKHWMV